jgi:ribosomal protein S21
MSAIEVTRVGTESNANLLRRFTKRVQTSGNLRRARALQFSTRNKSELKNKKEALKRIIKRTTNDRLRKLGKIKDVVRK